MCEPTDPIDQLVIHMYKMGTGDCFVLKFMQDGEVTFKLMIDCGCYVRKYAEIREFVKALKEDVDDHVHALVITHEHSDHVLGFQAAEALFTDGNFRADEVWMGWTENDADDKVKEWKKDYGQKRFALARAAGVLAERAKTDAFQQQFAGSRGQGALLAARQRFSDVLKEFAELHVDGDYKGGLKGMTVVKEKLEKDRTVYFDPGDLLEEIPGLPGVRIYFLGPPALYDEVKKEHGGDDESYEHNDQIDDSELFLRAVESSGGVDSSDLLPFDASSVAGHAHAAKAAYEAPSDAWRRIDHDWLFSAGQFALRMNSLTNNLSVVMAIEFIASGKVVLFPGDAEFGSWKSWHDLDWGSIVDGVTTEDLLKRTVFYKVAHHLSHNGTAKSIGLDLMTSDDLVAMATLDYDVISSGWKSTMPNRGILRDLLEKTKGRTIVMNTKDLFYDQAETVPLDDRIAEQLDELTTAEREAFDNALDTSSSFFTEFVIDL